MVTTKSFGEVFRDGKMMEPVRGGSDDETLSLLFWNGSTAKVGARIRHNGRTYEAARVHPHVMRAMTLPANTAMYGSTRELLADVCATVQRYSGLDEELTMLVGRFALASWLIGSGPTAPRLSILGPETAVGMQLLQLLRCICRRPLTLTEVDTAGIRSLPMEWRPTLLIRQPQLNVRVERLLSAARTRDVRVPQRGRLLDLHCAIATYTELPRVRASGAFGGIEIPVHAVVQNLPTVDHSTEREIADLFQPKLLGYRLANYMKVSRSLYDVPKFKSPMREIARGMAARTPDDRDLQDEVVRVLEQRGADHLADRWTDLNCAVIEAVLARCHLGESDALYVGQIAHDVEVILAGRGEDCEIKAREIGERLRMLGLFTGPRDSKGFRLCLTKAVRREIHVLARDFSVPTIDGNVGRCSDRGL